MNEQERQALYDNNEAYALAFARNRYRIPRHLAGVLSMDDVDQHARIGLWNATKRYDPDGLHRGRPFRTVATFAIQHEIRKALQLDALPLEDQPTQPMVTLSILPLEPPSWLVADEYRTRELPALSTVEEQVIAAVDGAQVSATLEAALLLLTPKQRAIIERRYGLSGDGVCWTMEECGRLLSIHKSNVCRQQQKALSTLRAHLLQSDEGMVTLRQLNERQQSGRARLKRAA